MIKVRFNLGKKYYKFWKITYCKNHHAYYDPSSCDLVMTTCRLKNQKATANKINAGANKSVCAWIECDHVEIVEKAGNPDNLARIYYNPKINPFWTDSKENNVDNLYFEKLLGINGRIYDGNSTTDKSIDQEEEIECGYREDC